MKEHAGQKKRDKIPTKNVMQNAWMVCGTKEKRSLRIFMGCFQLP